MLIALPNGNWIDHTAVSGVRIVDSNGLRVLIYATTGYLEDIPFATCEAAESWVDQFARQCWSAREGNSK